MSVANAIALSGSSQSLRAVFGIYRGFTIRETSGTLGAVVRLWDNAAAASGTIVETISLVAGESSSDYLGDNEGVRLNNGLWVEIVSGTVEGSVRFG